MQKAAGKAAAEVPWFPKSIAELDRLWEDDEKEYLEPDHVGYTEPEFRKRRKMFAEIACHYKHGQPIPWIEYTEEELKTWSTVYRSLVELFPTHACEEFNRLFPAIRDACFREDKVPQLREVSEFLKANSGFTLRPAPGEVQPRQAFAGFAFRVFHSTQFLRHPTTMSFITEPDICHELLGHTVIFSDPEFADLFQEIGLGSLGATDEQIDKLSNIYWFTFEAGMCRQNGKMRAYGGGTLSSYGELPYSVTDEPKFQPLDTELAQTQEYPVETFQTHYHVVASVKEALQKVSEYARSIPKPFTLRYNRETQSVEVINKNGTE